MICGNKSSMGKEVGNTLVKVKGDDGEAWKDKGIEDGRFMMEVWGE